MAQGQPSIRLEGAQGRVNRSAGWYPVAAMSDRHLVEKVLTEMYGAAPGYLDLGVLPLEGPLTVWDWEFLQSVELPLRGAVRAGVYDIDGEIAAYVLGEVDDRSELVDPERNTEPQPLALGASSGDGVYRSWIGLGRSADAEVLHDEGLSLDTSRVRPDEFISRAEGLAGAHLLLLAAPDIASPDRDDEMRVEVQLARDAAGVVQGAMLLFVWV
jgi:hypothetical protein